MHLVVQSLFGIMLASLLACSPMPPRKDSVFIQESRISPFNVYYRENVKISGSTYDTYEVSGSIQSISNIAPTRINLKLGRLIHEDDKLNIFDEYASTIANGGSLDFKIKFTSRDIPNLAIVDCDGLFEPKILRVNMNNDRSVSLGTINVSAGSTVVGKITPKLDTAELAGARVTIKSAEWIDRAKLTILNEHLGGLPQSVISRSNNIQGDGSFSIFGVPAGNVQVIIEVPGYLSKSIRGIISDSSNINNIGELSLEKGGVICGSLHKDKFNMQKLSVVCASVADGKGLQNLDFAKKTKVFADGRFYFENLPFDQYYIYLYDEGIENKTLKMFRLGDPNFNRKKFLNLTSESPIQSVEF